MLTNHMKIIDFVIILFLTLSVSGCKDLPYIKVSGRVIDQNTKKPIPNAEVLVICWYKSDINETSFRKMTVFTDQKGKYNANFPRGHCVDVASKSEGYIAKRKYGKFAKRNINVNLELEKAKQNPTLIHYLSVDNSLNDDESTIPFLRVRFYASDSSNNLDFSKAQIFGFDFQTLKTIADTNKCDFWFKPTERDEPPSILVAKGRGGIIPVYSNEIQSAFLYDKSTAPTSGYQKEYRLKGNEEGFFVLNRDGNKYGKLIFLESEIDKGGTNEKGVYYKESGKEFSILYQPNGSTDLSFAEPDIELENFLVDYRLR